MYKLYLDTCILNDAYPMFRNESGDKIRPIDVKRPLSRWAAEYVALYHMLDLDDQWELIFGTSEITMQEIASFAPRDPLGSEKMRFLEDTYALMEEICSIETGPIDPILARRIERLIGKGRDPLHLCLAIQGGWEFFITTDFKTILGLNREMEPIIEKEFGIKTRSPVNFLQENLLDLPLLIRTLYGSWTDPEKFLTQAGSALVELSKG